MCARHARRAASMLFHPNLAGKILTFAGYWVMRRDGRSPVFPFLEMTEIGTPLLE